MYTVRHHHHHYIYPQIVGHVMKRVQNDVCDDVNHYCVRRHFVFPIGDNYF